MSLFGKLFSTEKSNPEVLARKKAIEDFSQKLKLFGINSFRLQVGDNQGKHTDTLFILSSKPNNPDVEGFLQNSLLKQHTAKNLMSIGFNQIGIPENGSQGVKLISLSRFSQMTDIYLFNLKHLINKVEQHFDTIINSFGIETKGTPLFNQLSTSSNMGSYLGYLVIPVDEDGEYLITRNSSNDFDMSNILNAFEAQSSIIPTEELINFVQNEFQGRFYCSKMIRFENAPDKNRILSNMTSEDKFIYIHYYID